MVRSKHVGEALRLHSREVPTESRKRSEDSQRTLTSDEVKAGTNTSRTATEWQDLLKNTHLGEIFGVSHFFQDKELD